MKNPTVLASFFQNDWYNFLLFTKDKKVVYKKSFELIKNAIIENFIDNVLLLDNKNLRKLDFFLQMLLKDKKPLSFNTISNDYKMRISQFCEALCNDGCFHIIMISHFLSFKNLRTDLYDIQFNQRQCTHELPLTIEMGAPDFDFISDPSKIK